MGDEVLIERRTDLPAAIVTINRPAKRNACNEATWRGLGDAFRSLSRDGTTRLAVLTGAGAHFCAGDDIKDFSRVRDDPAAADAYRAAIRESYAAIGAAPFPIIAALSGYCIGGAVSLAMSCDFRTADASAMFGLPPARLGEVYPVEQTRRLVMLAGPSWARRLLFSGERVDAATAHRIGLVDALAGTDPIAAALEFGRAMTESAPLAVAGSKRIVNAVLDGADQRDAALLAAAIRRAEESDDIREGARAFATKRPPRFQGR